MGLPGRISLRMAYLMLRAQSTSVIRLQLPLLSCYKICNGVPWIVRSLASKTASKGKKSELLPREILLDGDVTVKKLSKMMSSSPRSILSLLKELGEDTSSGTNTSIEVGVAEFILAENGFTAIFPKESDLEDIQPRTLELGDPRLLPRAPVVTVMGHVDHGKTTLLDTLRKTSVASGESGGITQHIGAFATTVPSGRKITFIDTPGHASFNAMRARGAKVTDIVVLVIAADDGVQGQTTECIGHAKEAKVPIIVAINKVDKAPDKVSEVKRNLLEYGIHIEEFGGDIPCVEISALKGKNLEQLEEAILLAADMAELKADREGEVQGVILETKTSKGKGKVSTVLVQHGCLQNGQYIVAGSAFAKVRQLLDYHGNTVAMALPSDPVQVLGWRTLPDPGDLALQVESEDKAKRILKSRLLNEYLKTSKVDQEPTHSLSLKDDRPTQRGIKKSLTPFRVIRRRLAASGLDHETQAGPKKFEIIIKADVNGSLEAFSDTINRFKSKDLQLSVLHSGLGSIGESDVNLAASASAMIYGFNVTPSKQVSALASRLKVPIKTHGIIYRLLDDLKAELEKLLPPVIEESKLGDADVLQVFTLTGSRKATVAGCRVKHGLFAKEDNTEFRVIRKREVIYTGPAKSLKRGQDDAVRIAAGSECGLTFDEFSDLQEGDKIHCLKVISKKQLVKWTD